RSAVEERPDKSSERAVLGVTDAGEFAISAFAECAREGTGGTRARGDHDRPGDLICGSSSDEKFVHARDVRMSVDAFTGRYLSVVSVRVQLGLIWCSR